MRRGRLLGSWLSNRFWLVLLVLLAFALRLYRLDFQSLRGDEALSVLYSARGFASILDITKQTSRHPPLHYSLLNLWMLLVGKSEFSVRFLFLLLWRPRSSLNPLLASAGRDGEVVYCICAPPR